MKVEVSFCVLQLACEKDYYNVGETVKGEIMTLECGSTVV